VRIFHVQKVSAIGGSERHLLALLPALAEAGVEVHMCVPATGRAADFTTKLEQLGIPFSTLPAGPDANPLLVAALARRIRAFRPDLVHTHLIHADLHGRMAASLAGVASVSSIHSTHGFYRRQPFRTAMRIAGRAARRTIAISAHVQRFVEELGMARPGTVRMVHYGLDASRWAATDQERSRARASLELDRDAVVVGVAARLVPHKGHAHLLEGFAQALPRAPRLRLLVAGDGPLRDSLRGQASGLGDAVRFLGFVEDIRSFMSACDVLAFPSQPEFGEGFGLAALEGMAVGRPVVATSVCSLPEVVGGPESGILVDPANPAELGDALARLAASAGLRARMGESAQRRVRETFSLERMVERTISVYDEALAA
jgi:glycosyltransferase involved in cell wall biosynthesis